jgi:hypothetical protein
MRRLIVVAALALLVPAAASAARPPVPVPDPQPVGGTWAPGVEISYTETLRDAAGQIVSQTHRDGIPPGTLFGSAGGGASIAGSGAPQQPTVRRLAACCSSSGSDTVDLTVTKRSFTTWFVAWRYHQVNHWCWQYPNITCFNAASYFTDVDATGQVHYDSNGFGWYYTWAGGPSGGHYSHRGGRIDNCILRYGCISSYYPYVDIWVNGNGAWSGSGGGA